MSKVRTTCAYCGVGCGILASEKEGKFIIEGDKDHPANFGRLCSKGLALGDTFTPETRLQHPVVDGTKTDWQTAITEVAERLKGTLRNYGPDSIAFYVSGQLLTEDYYVANKLIKGFIGSANIDTNSRLCMSSAVAGHKRAFGADVMPGTFTDLEQADLVVLTGSNLAWCHPVLFQRLKAAKEKKGTKVVVIDPRRTETCDIADLHIPISPGSDTLLFNGLLAYLDAAGATPSNFSRQHVQGYAETLSKARQDREKLRKDAANRGIEDQIIEFFDLFSKTEKTVTLFSMGVNQAHDGTDRVNAIVNCHLATGRIGKPGMGPFSITGQPNAMGGREVGGLANMLAAHMDFTTENIDRVSRFWKAPNIAQGEGLKAVDLFNAVHSGKIKAIWIMATNPAVSMPNTNIVREALAACPLVIVSDCVTDTDTQKYAHIRLPALGWGEKNGTVTNSDRTISRQRTFKKTGAQAKPDWMIIRDIAWAMGWQEQFPYDAPADIFREHAALSGFENNGTRAFDISALKDIDDNAYGAMPPAKWPLPSSRTAQSRLFTNGHFYTDNHKARMVPIRHRDGSKAIKQYPFLLNTGRYRDQWHTMTRTGLSHKLTGHRPEPLLDISVCNADALKLASGDFVQVKSALGSMTARVQVTDTQQAGEVFLPIHWSDSHAQNANTCRMIAPIVDPISAQPAFKATPVSLEPKQMVWHCLLLTKTKPQNLHTDYWTITKQENCYLTRLAGGNRSPLQDFPIVTEYEGGDILEWTGGTPHTRRGALIHGDMLQAVWFEGPSLKDIDLTWLQSLFTSPICPENRSIILSGRGRTAPQDTGPLVCSCFQIGTHQISSAISKHQLNSIEAIGCKLSAGTNCGSCIPELRALLNHSKAKLMGEREKEEYHAS